VTDSPGVLHGSISQALLPEKRSTSSALATTSIASPTWKCRNQENLKCHRGCPFLADFLGVLHAAWPELLTV
jgi:hypothetical protein